MMPPRKRLGAAATLLGAVLCALLVAGCRTQPNAGGSFDKTFTVTGPVRIEMTNGSGDSRVTVGADREVRIHGEIQVRSWSEKSGQRKVGDLQMNPPLSQDGSLIRVGAPGAGANVKDVSIDYTITVPADTEVRAVTGSGDLEVTGVKGPANFVTGSGDIKVAKISGDVHVTAGSGSVELSEVGGQVQVTAGSGDVTIDRVHDDIRLQTGSGSIEMTDPAGKVEANTGSGDVTIRGAADDLRIRTTSGAVTADGNPGASSYWDFHTSSGDVVLHVPSDASFRFYARSSSGDISAEIPVTMEGTSGKHEFQAKIGDGKARVEVSSSSGSISLK